jgi:imidazolonepropionase-like amidohydrolase
MLAIVGGTLFDGSGRDLLEHAAILIEGNIFKEVGQKDRIGLPEGCEIIDVTGKTLIPGMIDTHVHLVLGPEEQIVWKWGVIPPLLEHSLPLIGLKAYARAKEALEMGFTSLRDVGDIGYAVVALRDAINAGIVEGPRIQASGPYLNTTGGHGNAMPPWLIRTDLLYPVADGVEGVLKAVRQNIKMNTDWIKFTATGGGTTNTWDKQQFNEDEMRALINEAHEKGKPVAGHCVWAKGTLTAVRLGIDTVEHGIDLTEEIVDLMTEKGTYLVPTLYAPMEIGKRGKEFGFSPEQVAAAQRVVERHIRSYQMALKAGVKIAMGTDAGYGPPIHGTNAYELELMVENGMTPMQALMAVTSTAAGLMRIDDKVGTVEEGKLADLVVVDGNPLEDIKILQDKEKILLVMKDGNIHVNRMGDS